MTRRHLCRVCLICAAVAEPIFHAFGIPHPEGLSSMAINMLATTAEETTP